MMDAHQDMSSHDHHQSSLSLLAHKRKPLATLAALRRPPIDPIVLAASLTTGPHVTRHHFHHSYGTDPGLTVDGHHHDGGHLGHRHGGGAGASGGGGAAGGGGMDPIEVLTRRGELAPEARHHGSSSQMARSDRLQLLKEQQERRTRQLRQKPSQSIEQQQQQASTSSSGRPSSAKSGQQQQQQPAESPVLRAGSYANCDLDDDEIAAIPAPPLSNPSAPSSRRTSAAKPPAPGSIPAARASAASARGDPPVLHEIMQEVMMGASGPAPAVSAEELEAEKFAEGRSEMSLYSSRQMPRSLRIKVEEEEKKRLLLQKEEAKRRDEAQALAKVAPKFGPSAEEILLQEQEKQAALSAAAAAVVGKGASVKSKPPLNVRCYARTRVPTPHGEVFCHLYRNNHDNKEHLALVVDWEQNDEDAMQLYDDAAVAAEGTAERELLKKPPGKLRSRTLEERWSADETDMERIVRGAYVGRLGPTFQKASIARPSMRQQGKQTAAQLLKAAAEAAEAEAQAAEDAAPLVRIHSECYTGETIGSQRCDCGEQLDEAIRLISSSGSSYANGKPRGVVVYLRQEGRGIGLLDKLMAYNLQDMGHDTVSANILLGHLPDARKYDIASAILRDLGVDECRLLTNNPEKMEALEAEGVHVTERVAMVPRMWRRRSSRKPKKSRRRGHDRVQSASRKRDISAGSSHHHHHPHPLQQSILSQFSHADGDAAGLYDGVESGAHDDDDVSDAESAASSQDSYVEHVLRRSGATMLGGSITRGPELEKYLRTKVERMGHMLVLPPSHDEAETSRSSPGPLNSEFPGAGPGRTLKTHPTTPSQRQVPTTPSSPLPDGPLKVPPHLRSASGAGGSAEMSRSPSHISLDSQPESVLGESELREMMASTSISHSGASFLGQAGTAHTAHEANAGSRERALSTEVSSLLQACKQAEGDESFNAFLSASSVLEKVKSHIDALEPQQGELDTRKTECAQHAEEIMDLLGNAIENADMGTVKQSAISTSAHIMLCAGKVLRATAASSASPLPA